MLPSALFAQSSATGAITGVVTDQSGAVLSRVTVTAENAATRASQTTVTNEEGVYTVPSLLPGIYSLRFSLSGFQEVIRTGVQVKVTERASVNAALKVGALTEEITVSSEPAQLQTEEATLGGVVSGRQINELPLITRNYTQIMALSTGVSTDLPDPTRIGQASQTIAANGVSPVYNNYQFNGIDSTQFMYGSVGGDPGNNNISVPAPDTIQEFKVQTATFSAAYGRDSGAHVNVVTKSGTTSIHGTAFEYFRNDKLNANDFFFNRAGLHRPVLKQNQFGFTLGGPVPVGPFKDETFWFIGYQGTRQRNGADLTNSQQSGFLPPIPPVRTRQALGAIFGGQRGAFGGVAVAPDGSNINDVALRLLNFKLPNGNSLIPSPRDSSGFFIANDISRYREDQYTFNLDHTFSAKDRFSGRFFGSHQPGRLAFSLGGTAPGIGGTFVLPGHPQGAISINKSVSLSWTHIFGPTMINELRVGFSRQARFYEQVSPFNGQDVGLSRFSQDLFPRGPWIGVNGSFAIGASNLNPNNTTGNSFNYVDTLSFQRTWKGTHQMQVGADVRRRQTNWVAPFFQNGLIGFRSFADFLLGLPGGPVEQGGNGTAFSNVFSSAISSGILAGADRGFDHAYFIQDDWKVTPNLTLNLGMRYEVLGPDFDLRGRLTGFDLKQYTVPAPGQGTTAGFRLADNASPEIKQRLAGLPPIRKSVIPTDYNNFAPRLGFAWRPFGLKNMVVRGGYGIFYQYYTVGVTAFTSAIGPPFVEFNFRVGTANSVASFTNPFPVLPLPSQYPVPLVYFAPPYTADHQPRNISFNNIYNMRSPYVQKFSLDVQYQLTPSVMLEVGYVGHLGRKLPRKYTINQAILASADHPVNGITTNTAQNALLRVPYPGFLPTGMTATNSDGNSSYNSLQVSVSKRYSHGLQMGASYTYSKLIDEVSGGSTGNQGPTTSGDQTNRRENRGLSDFDRTHRFVINGIYELPLLPGAAFRENKFLNGMFRGWQMAAIATAQSGLPLTITDSGGALLYGVNSSRASWAPGATVETAQLHGRTQDRLARYFNTSAFTGAGMFFGNVGRNVLRGPGQRNVDFSLIKNTPLSANREGMILQFRAEFFNVFNIVNFANPGSAFGSPSFGRISKTAGPPRIIQFALKLLF
jgi:hypothetical protein